jgi:hypothetical protein
MIRGLFHVEHLGGLDPPGFLAPARRSSKSTIIFGNRAKKLVDKLLQMV